MSYRLVKRKIPSGTKPIRFYFKDNSKFGMLNLCCWKDEISRIKDANRMVSNRKTIKIYFPVHEHYFVKEYSSKTGFTFRQLVDKIAKAGIQAGKYDMMKNPEHYRWTEGSKIDGRNFIGEYAITSNGVTDIKMKGGNVYVKVQH